MSFDDRSKGFVWFFSFLTYFSNLEEESLENLILLLDDRAFFYSDRPTVADTIPISRLLIDHFLSGEMDEVYLVYTRFISTMSQEPVVEKLLPVTPSTLSAADRSGYIYEPDSLTVLGSLLPQFVDMEVYHALLESIASEQSARMVAMRNATDNAKSLAGDLTLVMNKLRQDSITNELLDLVGGQIALEG